MPVSQYLKLKGLTANDRTAEEKKAINQQMGYDTSNKLSFNIAPTEAPSFDSASVEMLNNIAMYQQHLDEQYNQALNERQQAYGVAKNSINTGANEYLDKIASNASSYYKRYKGTDKLPIDDQQKKELAAQYDARKATYGEDNANVWLDKQFKDIVGNNQSWFEQATNAVGHLIPAIEGGAIQAFGMAYGAVKHFLNPSTTDLQAYDTMPLSAMDRFINDVIDNPITRYGRDVELAGASNIVQGLGNILGITDESASERIAATKASATKYNPEGIGSDAIVTTQEQDDSLISSATPWQALQSGGFTALSMLVGAGEAKLAGSLFNYAAKGANWLNSTGRAFKTAESLEKALKGIKRAQNFTDTFVIPAAVGSMEGGLEGLSTKIDVEREAVQNLDEYYKNKVDKEVEAILADEEQNPLVEITTDNGGKKLTRLLDPNETYRRVWEKYKDEYTDVRRQIDWASSKAGIHNFWANSLINGAINQTLKAGIMAPRVQETLRNSKMFGWAYKNPKFTIAEDGVTVTPKMSKAGIIGRVLKEPLGEGLEEYSQSLSNDVFSGAAENNINEYIKNKFEGDGTAKITDSFGSDYAAALTALTGSLSNKESIQSAILGAVSSTMGTVGGIGRGYHRDENGKLVRNSLLDARNLTRGLDSEGNKESWTDYARRVTPWRSGAINAYFDRRQEMKDAEETAANLTEWLKDPQNRAKWDGLTGTANWMTQMENASESNDQFSYRKAQMGKAVNDIFMLKKLEGTDFHDSIIENLHKAANGELSQEEIATLKKNGGEDYQNVSDQEIVERVQSNANRMLGLMSQVEQESKNLDRLLGRIDEDTKQSLIYGSIMEENFKERRDELKEEINTITSRINSSRGRSNVSLDDDLRNLILKHGSINKALKAQERLQSEKEKLEQKIDELEAIDPNKTSDKQKEELLRSKAELKQTNKELEGFKGLYNEEGQIDSSLAQLILNEEEIMDLDPVTRAMVLAQGANRLYNATHQNRQKVDQLNLEIDEINKQIDTLEAQKQKWTKSNGSGVKKGHNKQYNRNTKKIEELQKQKEAKMRALDAEQGKMDTKPIYNSAQQEVIDNLVQQGMAQDRDFLDKVVDMGRLEKGIKDYHQQYQAILSDPKAFQNYVQRAKYNAQRDITRRRAERVAKIEDFKEYSQELDKLTANASDAEMREIYNTIRNEDAKQKRNYQKDNMVVDENTGKLVAPAEQPKTNYDKYIENSKKQGDLIRQFAKNPNLTDNDQSLLLDAMQYLSSNGIDLTDREAAVQALIEKDEQGNIGGKFRQWVEAKNDNRVEQQRTFMPQFTSIGQIVGDYVNLINGTTEDAVNRGNANPTVSVDTSGAGIIDTSSPAPATVVTSPSPSAPEPEATSTGQPAASSAAPSLFNIGYSSPEGGQVIDGEGTVATDTQTQNVQQRQQQNQPEEDKSQLRQQFEQVTTPEIAKMVDEASHLIDNSNLSDDVKTIARQYLEAIAVNGNETFSTLDDLMTAVQEKVDTLKAMSSTTSQQEQQENFNEAAGLLQKVYGSLSAKKMRGRRRTTPNIPHREENPEASWISTANIPYMEQQNPDSWAVVFTDNHKVDKYVEDNWLNGFDNDTPVYFITNSEWAAEVISQMQSSGNRYDTLTHMPIVAAIRVEAPQNPANTTAIEVNGLWYQPIGVMPSTTSKVSGAVSTNKLRSLASKEQGVHLIASDGMPNGKPLISHVYAVKGHHRDHTLDKRHNSKESNNSVYDIILDDSSRELWEKAQSSERKDILDDTEYMNERSSFLGRLSIEQDFGGTSNPHTAIVYTPKSMKKGKDGKEEAGSQIEIFTKSMSETTDRDTGKNSLGDVLQNGKAEDVVNFNSRTQRLYNEVIRPIFQYIQYNPVSRSGDSADRAAKIITQDDLTANPNAFQEEADRLTKLLNGYDGREETKGLKGVSSFIYVKPGSGWSIKVTAPHNLQTVGDESSSQSAYKVFFVNTDSNITPIELGTIRAGQRDTGAAMELLRNIMFDASTGQVRDFLNWQVPYSDIQNIHNPNTDRSTQARKNIAAIIDDGLLEVPATSLRYDIDGLKLRAPFKSDGSPAYPVDTVVNPTNAQPTAPQNNTPQGEGETLTSNGQPVDANSGANLGEKPEGKSPDTVAKSEKLKQAEKITNKIIADSKEFTLSEDETHYYITDKNTGEKVKYLRVTTVIGADESAPQWEPEIKDVLDKLKERHSISDDAYSAKYLDTQDMSDKLNIPVSDIKRAIAELRTVHKHEGYGAWSTPSTSIGNTFDAITRDFLAGHLKENYPNVNKEVLDTFVHQLELFKADCDSKGIHLVSEGIMAHGTITMTDEEGNTHDVKVAGTLDLFGYDDDGNFYIFDMKTTRKHTEEKLKQEKAKWSRQVSMYADLLKQSYPGFTITADRLRIIPINIDYPTPMGKRENYLDPSGPKYSEIKEGEKKGQLQTQLRGQSEPEDFIMEMPKNPKESNGDNAVGMRKTGWREQYKPGYTPFNINWDNLSSEDQDIADALVTQTNDAEHSAEQTPQEAYIETPKPRRPSFLAQDAFVDDDTEDTLEAAPQTPPVTPNGQKPILPSWRNLSNAQKEILESIYGIDNMEDYNELLDDPATAQGIAKDLGCKRVM